MRRNLCKNRRILSLGFERIVPEYFGPRFKNSGDNKIMYGGIYGSTLQPEAYYPSGWAMFCDDTLPDKYISFGVSYKLKKKSRICQIDTFEDYMKVIDKYSYLDEEKYRPTYLIDFEKMAKDYDAFHLTENGFSTMRLPYFNYSSFFRIEDYGLGDFYSYDCETWIIFNLNCINKSTVRFEKFPQFTDRDFAIKHNTDPDNPIDIDLKSRIDQIQSGTPLPF